MDSSKLTEFLDSLRDKGIPGCDCVVYKDHKEVFRHITGYADNNETRPLTKDTTYWLYSATKIITCTALMQLVDKGSIALDDPVHKYLPEYEKMNVRQGSAIRPAKNTMTIRHLLTMQSGLNYNLAPPSIKNVVKSTRGKASTRQIIEALSYEPLDFEPGTHYEYSLSHDVLGAIIEVVSGQNFGEYLDEHIFQPLGMTNTGFKLTPELKANMSDQFICNVDTLAIVPTKRANVYVLSDNYESGGAGLISTVDDYILFLDALANRGVGHIGNRILSMESINEMRTDQLKGVSRDDFALHEQIGYGYGLGVRTLIDKEISGARSPLGEFGWGGAAGAYALIDVENSLSIFYAQHVLECEVTRGVVPTSIRDLTYEMLRL
ncbi:MAG: beta-lactamase family protein [Clostridiales bacterium]|nr:beta-lactamase family protein [Clostridiales bacterium]